MFRSTGGFSISALILALASPALAQQVPDGAALSPVAVAPATQVAGGPQTPAPIPDLKGKRVLVTTKDGRQYDGHFESTSEGLRSDSGVVLPTLQVGKVERVTHRVATGLLVGLGLGAGIGAMSWILSCDDDCSTAGLLLPPMIGAGIGAALGSAANAAHRRSDVIFDATAHKTTTFAVAPILSPTRKGVAFSMSWR